MDPRSGKERVARSQKPDLLKVADGPHSRCCSAGENDGVGEGGGNTVLGCASLGGIAARLPCKGVEAVETGTPLHGRARSTDTQDKKGMSRPSLCLLVLLLSHAAILFAAAAPFLVKCLSCAIRRPPSPPIPRRPHPLPHRPNHIATLEPPGKPPVDAVQGFISCAQPSVHPWTPGPSQLFSLELQTSQSFPRLLLSPRQQRCESPRLTFRRASAGTSLDASCSLGASSSPTSPSTGGRAEQLRKPPKWPTLPILKRPRRPRCRVSHGRAPQVQLGKGWMC